MKRLLTIFTILCCLAGCTDEHLSSLSPTKQSGISVCDYQWDGPLSRTTGAVTETGITYTWASGDRFGVYPATTGDNQIYFTVTEDGVGASSASFDGGAYSLTAGSSYVAYYPYNYANEQATAVAYDFSGQSQNANNSMSNIGTCDFMYAAVTAEDGGVANFQFHHVGAIAQFTLSLPESAKVTQFTLSTEGYTLPLSGSMDILTSSEPVLTPSAYSSSLDVSLGNFIVSSGTDLVVYATLPVVDLSSAILTLTVQNANGTAYVGKVRGRNMKQGKAYAYEADMAIDFGSAPAAVSAIDLGLTSGTKWANMNVGATEPSDYGLRVAWGETYEKNNYLTSTYFDSTYALFPGSANVQQTGYDGAYVNWGTDWMLPTHAQMTELRQQCTWTWTQQNGVSGNLVTGPNGKSIFLPCCGYLHDNSSSYEDIYGFYWTANGASNKTYAYGIGFAQSQTIYWSYFSRINGRGLRAIKKS